MSITVVVVVVRTQDGEYKRSIPTVACPSAHWVAITSSAIAPSALSGEHLVQVQPRSDRFNYVFSGSGSGSGSNNNNNNNNSFDYHQPALLVLALSSGEQEGLRVE